MVMFCWGKGFTWVAGIWITGMFGPAEVCWEDLGWENPKFWRKWRSGGVEGGVSLSLVFGWSETLNDLVLGNLFWWSRSKKGSNRAARSSSAELALGMLLEIVDLLLTGVLLRIFSGLSTVSGGFGSGKALVWMVLWARVLFISQAA